MMGKPPWEQPPSTIPDNDSSGLLPHKWVNLMESYIAKNNALFELKTMKPLTRRQRLRLKWQDFRWWLGHKIVGYECDEDDW